MPLGTFIHYNQHCGPFPQFKLSLAPKLTPFPLFPSTRLLTFLGICQKPSVVPDPTDDQVNDSALMDFTVSRKRL